MAPLLKNKFNHQQVSELALNIKTVYRQFQIDDFINDVIDESWVELELKARMRQITINLGKHLPKNYNQALLILDQAIANYPPDFNDFTLMVFPDFVEVFGQNKSQRDLSIEALKRYTPFSSSEFAVRPFIVNDEKRMMQEMLIWAKDENPHVRRLASEGCRPLLPWGQVLVNFKKDPTLILPILEQLKTDSSLYVRKSVANNLNDISKSHPDLVIKIAKNWYGKNQNTDWILKHSCRTLLKKGNSEILALFGYHDIKNIEIQNFVLETNSVIYGEKISFSFAVSTNESVKLRLEYAIDYVKANGKRNQKIFQISESSLEAGQIKKYIKTHSFLDLSSRKHYPGTHSITLIVNGQRQTTFDFELLAIK